jgi:hypothetical protein
MDKHINVMPRLTSPRDAFAPLYSLVALADASSSGERINCLGQVDRRSQHDISRNNWFGGESPYGGAFDMFYPESKRLSSGRDLGGRVGEQTRPCRVVIANYQLIRVRTHIAEIMVLLPPPTRRRRSRASAIGIARVGANSRIFDKSSLKSPLRLGATRVQLRC